MAAERKSNKRQNYRPGGPSAYHCPFQRCGYHTADQMELIQHYTGRHNVTEADFHARPEFFTVKPGE